MNQTGDDQVLEFDDSEFTPYEPPPMYCGAGNDDYPELKCDGRYGHDGPHTNANQGAEWMNAPKGPQRPTAHAVDIAFPSGQTPTITVDGVDVAKLTTSMVVFAQAGSGPKVCLELSPYDLGIRSDTASVEVGGATRDLLVKLGWTPPAAPKTPVASGSNDVQH